MRVGQGAPCVFTGKPTRKGHRLSLQAVVHGVAVDAGTGHRRLAGVRKGQDDGHQADALPSFPDCHIPPPLARLATENLHPGVAFVHHAEPAPGIEADLGRKEELSMGLAGSEKAVA